MMQSLIRLAADNGWTDIEEVLRCCHPEGRWEGDPSVYESSEE